MTAADVVAIVEMFRSAQSSIGVAPDPVYPALRPGPLTHNERRMLRRIMFTPGAREALNADQRAFLNAQAVAAY